MRNGSGTYSLPVNSWNPATNGVPATAADWQALINDVAAAITQSVSRDGQAAMSGNLPMASNKLTGLGAGSAVGDSAAWQQLFSLGVPANIASAATMDIGVPNTTILNVTGTTTISSFGINYNGPRFLRFDGALTLTHSAALALPGGVSITTTAGACAIAVPNVALNGWVVLTYTSSAALPNSVNTAALQDNSVIFAKMQDVATNTVLGRSAAGTGDLEALNVLPPVSGENLTNLNASSLTSGNVPAARLSGSYAIDISGNAETANSANLIDGRGFLNADVGNPVVGADTFLSNGIGYVNATALFGQVDGALYGQFYDSTFGHQIFGDYRTGQVAVRGRASSSFAAWRTVLDSLNFNSYAPTLTGGGASGTWGINITGNAGTASLAANSNALAGLSLPEVDSRYSTDRPQSGVGVVGSYAFMRIESGGLSLEPGDTAAGSNLRYGSLNSAVDVRTTGVVPAGTWRCCGGGPVQDTLYSVFQRIA